MKRCHLGLFDDNFNLSVNIYFCAHIETQGYGKESFMQGQREKERHGAAVTHFLQKEKKKRSKLRHTHNSGKAKERFVQVSLLQSDHFLI